jgi:hypothetical protein
VLIIFGIIVCILPLVALYPQVAAIVEYYYCLEIKVGRFHVVDLPRDSYFLLYIGIVKTDYFILLTSSMSIVKPDTIKGYST